jgi:hypothetical protein
MAAWYGDQAALFTSITSGGSYDAPHRWAFPDPRLPRNLHLNFMPFGQEPYCGFARHRILSECGVIVIFGESQEFGTRPVQP